ncbi:unnamed protein product [Ixodes hexagonus]
MNTAVIMRNSKARTFLYVLLACAMMFTVFLLSTTHTKLKDTQDSHEKCQQQRDSLSAQLQVVYEHKSRLEKTLQAETLERKKTDEALQLSREEWARDKQSSQSKINELEKKMEERDKTHQEEFGNLKSSYNSLQQEKEKLEADLARHVTLLQQEKDVQVSLKKEIDQLRDLKQKGDITLDAEVKKMQSQLEMCRSDQNQLQVAIQQLKSVQGLPRAPPQVADGEKYQNNAANNVQRAQVVGSAEVGAVPRKPEVKEERGAQKYGDQNQPFGAESQPRKWQGAQAGGEVNNAALGQPNEVLPAPRKPQVNEQVAAAPVAAVPVAKSSSTTTTTTTTTSTVRPPPALDDGAGIMQGAAPPLKERPRDPVKAPQNPIQHEGVEQLAQRPAEKPAAERPAQQIAQPAAPQLAKPVLRSADAAAVQAAKALGQADKDENNQEQPPLQAPGNDIGDEDEAVPLLKRKQVAAGRDNGNNNNNKMQVRAPAGKVANGGDPGDRLVAAGGDSVPVVGVAPDAEVPPKPVNGEAANAKNGDNAAAGRAADDSPMWGAHRNVGGWHGGRQREEDNQEYPNQAKDDDAAEDQEDDGPFGAAGDAAQGKHFPDAADFDDQAAEGDVQQPNHGREEGMMVNPK